MRAVKLVKNMSRVDFMLLFGVYMTLKSKERMEVSFEK